MSAPNVRVRNGRLVDDHGVLPECTCGGPPHALCCPAYAAHVAALRPVPPGAPEAVQQLTAELRAEGIEAGLVEPGPLCVMCGRNCPDPIGHTAYLKNEPAPCEPVGDVAPLKLGPGDHRIMRLSYELGPKSGPLLDEIREMGELVEAERARVEQLTVQRNAAIREVDLLTSQRDAALAEVERLRALHAAERALRLAARALHDAHLRDSQDDIRRARVEIAEARDRLRAAGGSP